MIKMVKLVLSEESKEKFEALGTPRSGEEMISLGFNWLGFFFSEIMLLVKTLWGTFIIAHIILSVVSGFVYFIFWLMILLSSLNGIDFPHNFDVEKMIGGFFAMFIILMVIFLVNGIIIGLNINKWYVKKLLTLGYFPATDEDRKVLIEKGILRK